MWPCGRCISAGRCLWDDEFHSLYRSGPGPQCCTPTKPREILCLDTRTFLCLDGVLLRLLPAQPYLDLVVHDVLLHVLRLLLARFPNQDRIQQSTPAQSVHFHFTHCAFSAFGQSSRRSWPVLHSRHQLAEREMSHSPSRSSDVTRSCDEPRTPLTRPLAHVNSPHC